MSLKNHHDPRTPYLSETTLSSDPLNSTLDTRQAFGRAPRYLLCTRQRLTLSIAPYSILSQFAEQMRVLVRPDAGGPFVTDGR